MKSKKSYGKHERNKKSFSTDFASTAKCTFRSLLTVIHAMSLHPSFARAPRAFRHCSIYIRDDVCVGVRQQYSFFFVKKTPSSYKHPHNLSKLPYSIPTSFTKRPGQQSKKPTMGLLPQTVASQWYQKRIKVVKKYTHTFCLCAVSTWCHFCKKSCVHIQTPPHHHQNYNNIVFNFNDVVWKHEDRNQKSPP